MPLGELTKQLAQQALLSATSAPAKEPAPAPQPDNAGAAILGQVAGMQKALKEDEELVIFFQHGATRLRVLEIYFPTWRVAVLGGADQERAMARVISPVDSLQLLVRVVKAQPGAKPVRIKLVAPKT